MMSKPSLHDIAAMPFPQSEQALEKHYGVKPKREWNEGVLKSFTVRIAYSWRTSDSIFYDIEAASEEEALKIAEERFDGDTSIDADDPDIDDVRVEGGPND